MKEHVTRILKLEKYLKYVVPIKSYGVFTVAFSAILFLKNSSKFNTPL